MGRASHCPGLQPDTILAGHSKHKAATSCRYCTLPALCCDWNGSQLSSDQLMVGCQSPVKQEPDTSLCARTAAAIFVEGSPGFPASDVAAFKSWSQVRTLQVTQTEISVVSAFRYLYIIAETFKNCFSVCRLNAVLYCNYIKM